MIRLVVLFLLCVAVAAGFSWLANQPGSLSLTWLGYQIDEIPIFLVVLVLLFIFFALWFIWWMIRVALGTPGALGDFFRLRRNRKGLDALSKGMVAVGAGDVSGAQRQAIAARKLMADNPLAHLLEAQAAQMRGDENKVKHVYTQMLDDPESELVALRGLYSLARKAGDDAEARRHAERALRVNPALAWASEAMMAYQSSDEDWPAALQLIESQRKSGVVDRDQAKVLRAVVLTAQAQAAEGKDNEAAADLATKAHKLDPKLIPAAVIAGRVLAEQGSLRKASKILEATWKVNPHPDIAEVYRHARMGDSTSDRLVRARDLLAVHHGDEEGAVALATAAIEALDWKTARGALRPYLEDRPRVRICTLMAEIEDGEFGDSGRSREWTARAVRAPDDPAWTADGYVSAEWLPSSPTTGRLGAFEWKVPLAALSYAGEDEMIPETIAVIGGAEVIDVEAEDVPVDDDAPIATDAEANDADARRCRDSGKRRSLLPKLPKRKAPIMKVLMMRQSRLSGPESLQTRPAKMTPNLEKLNLRPKRMASIWRSESQMTGSRLHLSRKRLNRWTHRSSMAMSGMQTIPRPRGSRMTLVRAPTSPSHGSDQPDKPVPAALRDNA